MEMKRDERVIFWKISEGKNIPCTIYLTKSPLRRRNLCKIKTKENNQQHCSPVTQTLIKEFSLISFSIFMQAKENAKINLNCRTKRKIQYV